MSSFYTRKHILLLGVYRKEKVQWIFYKYNFILHIYFNFRSIYFSKLNNIFFFEKKNCVQTMKSSSVLHDKWFMNWRYQFLQLCDIFIYNLKKWTSLTRETKIIDFYDIKSNLLYTWGVMVLYISYLYQVHYILIQQIWFKKVYLCDK